MIRAVVFAPFFFLLYAFSPPWDNFDFPETHRRPKVNCPAFNCKLGIVSHEGISSAPGRRDGHRARIEERRRAMSEIDSVGERRGRQ